jgi:hypothetical protein
VHNTPKCDINASTGIPPVSGLGSRARDLPHFALNRPEAEDVTAQSDDMGQGVSSGSGLDKSSWISIRMQRRTQLPRLLALFAGSSVGASHLSPLAGHQPPARAVPCPYQPGCANSQYSYFCDMPKWPKNASRGFTTAEPSNDSLNLAFGSTTHRHPNARCVRVCCHIPSVATETPPRLDTS